MSRGPLLVTGGSGYLGGEVLRQAADRAPVATHLSGPAPVTAGPGWTRLDVRDADAVRETMERVRPEAVVSTPPTARTARARARPRSDGAAIVAAAARRWVRGWCTSRAT